MRSFAVLSERLTIQRQLDRDKKLLENDPAGYHLWNTAMGRYWVPQRDDNVLTDNLAEQGTQVYGDREYGVQPGDVVFDCGANIGVYTRVALAAGAKLVVAIEPAPENVECLRRNYAAEIGQGRVIVVPKGVWDREDVLLLREDAGNSARDSFVGSFGPALRETRVPLTTIDRLVEELHLDSVGFMKLDIEGAEKRALAGARNTLRKYHPRMAIAMEHLDDDPVAIPRVVLAAAPSYRVVCGDCVDERFSVRPDVLFFR
jgi:FkbM family methyltransferase